MKDEALSPMGYRMENFPIALPTDDIRNHAALAVDRLIDIRRQVAEAGRMLHDWYAFEFEIDRPSRLLADPYSISIDQFLSEVKSGRGRSKPPSAAGVQVAREEYFRTIQPAQRLFHGANQLEWRLYDLVNETYGLTPDDVRLMWDTPPPPRRPLAQEHAAETETAA